MNIHRPAIAAVTIVLLGCVAGCDKGSETSTSSSASAAKAATPPAKDTKAGAATTAAAATTTAAAVAPEKKGDPVPTITPGPRKPFEALVFRNTGEVNKSGWPKFDVYNQSDKKVKYASLYGYAYDKDGKLVTKTETPLSWNDNSGLEPGKKANWPVELDSWGKAPVGPGAVKFEVCYDSMKFDDDKIENDAKLCAKTRPEGGVK